MGFDSTLSDLLGTWPPDSSAWREIHWPWKRHRCSWLPGIEGILFSGVASLRCSYRMNLFYNTENANILFSGSPRPIGLEMVEHVCLKKGSSYFCVFILPPWGGVKNVTYNYGCVKMQVLETVIFVDFWTYRSNIPASDNTGVKIVSCIFDPHLCLLSLYAVRAQKLWVTFLRVNWMHAPWPFSVEYLPIHSYNFEPSPAPPAFKVSRRRPLRGVVKKSKILV